MTTLAFPVTYLEVYPSRFWDACFLSVHPAFPINRIFLVLIALKFPIISCVLSYIFLLPRCCSEYFQNIFLSLRGFQTSGNRWWNDRDVGKSRYLEKDLSHIHVTHYKSHMDWAQYRTWASAVSGRQVISHRSNLISQYCLQNSTLHKQCS
jgi:hypothetical protein